MKDLLNKIKDNNILLEIVDGKLKLFTDTASINPDLIKEIRERKEELLQALQGNDQPDLNYSLNTNIPIVPEQADYALSSAQRRLWIVSQLPESNIAYNIPGVYWFKGALNIASLSYAFGMLLKRHESLRTVFIVNEQGEPRQLILPYDENTFAPGFLDLRERKEELHQQIRFDLIKEFDLRNGPLLRASVYQVADDNWVFTYVMHHISSDGWSMDILIRELLLFYNAHIKNETPSLPALAIQYKDYASWQQQQLNAVQKNYWLKQFSGELPVLELPLDKNRPAVKTYNGGNIYKQIDTQLFYALRNLSQQQDLTLFMGLLAAVSTMLYRYSGQEDIIIGSPTAGRELVELEHQIGCYLNTLPLRMQFNGQQSFTDLARQTRKTTLDAYKHQQYPFDELITELQLHRDHSRSPLFDVLVDYHDNRGRTLTGSGLIDGLEIETFDAVVPPVSKFDLSFIFIESAEGLDLLLEYNSDLFEKETIARMFSHFEGILKAVTTAPEQAIAELNYISAAERGMLLNEFNDIPLLYDGYRSIVDLFREQVMLEPDATALLFEGTALSYQQLDDFSERLAAHLSSKYALTADSLVGVMMERSEKLIIAILAILKAGAAYVPIDPAYPGPRKQFIVEDAAIELLITQSDFIFDLDYYKGPVFAIDVELDGLAAASVKMPYVKARSLAYVIYTSGSTGQPKGCAITNANLSHYISWANQYYFDSYAPGNFGLFTSISFDLSVTSIFCPLTQGGTLTIYAQQQDIPSILQHSFSLQSGINAIKLTPSHVNLLQQLDISETGISKVILGGEAVTEEHVRILKEINNSIQVYNEYGPTEATVGCIVKELEPGTPVLIGKPISATEIFILNDHQPAPVGVSGEICISGAGLAKQYLNNPSLTAQKFVPNPFRAGERMYRTGDLGRWLPDGEIQYFGRKDEQVKIRGYRIEPGEIENILLAYADITAAAVIVRENELAAYLVSNQSIEVADVKAYLSLHLPAYMLPAYYVQLESLPLTVNGKIDKKQLPDPEGLALTASEYVAPQTATEQQLAAIWQDILGKEKVGLKDNFFDIGGHSLSAIRLAGRLQKQFNVKIELKDIFNKPVLEDQVLLLADSSKASFISIPTAAIQLDYPLSSAQRRLWVLSQFPESNVAYNMPAAFVFEGKLSPSALSAAFKALITRHESLRTMFIQNEQGEPRQIILPADETNFKLDLRHISAEQGITDQLIRDDFKRPFDLTSGPLLRASLYQLAEDRWIFTYVMHHITSDGWSMEVLIDEILSFYNAHLTGKTAILPPLNIHYKDYATWQKAEDLSAHKNYWLKQLSGELPVIGLPYDKTRPSLKTFNGNTIDKPIDIRLSEGLKRLCQQHNATLYMGLLAAVTTLLHRYSEQEDIIIGSPVSGREHADLEQQIGFYLNTLALRMQLNGQQHFTDLLQNTRALTIAAYEHQLYPFDQLIDELQLQRDVSRSPLFDVLVDYHDNRNNKTGELTTADLQDGLRISRMPSNAGISKYDLTFIFTDTAQGLNLLIEYNSDLFERETIERMFSHFEGVLNAVIAAPQQTIAELDYISAAERGLLLNEFNDIPVLYEGYRSIVELFREQVMLHPDAAALTFEGATLSYQQLDDLSERLAAHLSSKYALHADSLVGVMMERSEKLIVAILAILKAGAAYVPVDPAYPGARKQFIVEDAAIELLITQSDFIFDLDYYNGPVFAIDVELDGLAAASASVPDVKAESLAYVIYTSGSTGQPKGCAITNANLSHYISWANQYYFDSYAPGNFGLFTSISFDLSVTSIFCPLTQGGTLSIYGQQQDIPSILQHSFSLQSGINAIKLTPSHVNLLQQLDISETGISKVILGGEAVTEEHVRILKEINPAIHIYNEYGPTEATVGCIVKELEPGTPVLIGKPISATEIFILNDHQLAPVGVSGEICISGAGLAKQYLNNPALTAQKFVANPFRAGERMYRTGDLGRWLPNGEIQYFGRKDEQVKIRGYRIEPGEIEIILLAYNDITAAAVIVRENELVAYLVSNQSIEVAEVKAYLSQHLPAYMLPAYYVQLESLPLTINGKIDKKQLPDPEGFALNGAEYIAPQTATEQQLASIWQEILVKDKVGVKDNFFDIGGDSIKILRMLAAVRKELGIDIPIADVYKHSTIEGLILHIAAHKDTLDQQQQHEAEKEAALLKEFEVLKVTILESALLNSQHKSDEANLDKDNSHKNNSDKYNSNKYSPDRKDSDRNIIDWNNIEDIYPMSDIEKGMAFESLLNQELGMYHDQMVHQRFFPQFDSKRFSHALKLVSNKHSILRTSFNLNDFDREVQLVHKNIQIPFSYKDISALPRSSQEEIIAAFLADEIKRPFDITAAPLWRMTAFDMGNDELIFVFQCHHAIIDGWSDALLMTALNNLYLQLGEDPDYVPAALKTTYKDFIIRHELDKKDESIRSFWKQELRDANRLDLFTPEIDLQLKRYDLDKQLLSRLEQTAVMLHTSVKAISFSAYLYMLKILNHDADILTGLVTNMRPNLEDSDQLLGCFLNTIPFRMDIQDTISGNTLVKKVQEQFIKLKPNERLSMHEIAQLHNKQAKAGNPFFDVLFDYVDFHAYNDVQEVSGDNDLPEFTMTGGIDLTNTFMDFLINRTGGNFVLTIRLARKLKTGFDTDSIANLFFRILNYIVATPEQSLSKADYISAEERKMLLTEFNNIPVLYNGEASVIDLFRKQVQQHPDATAVIFEGSALSYQQLDELSDRLAIHLMHQLKANDLVGIMMDRSEKLIISILGVLKAGFAYVPVDPAYPTARKEFIITDAAIQMLITQTDYIFNLDYYKGAVFAIDAQLDLTTNPEQMPVWPDYDPQAAAYVIYTSGSTGQPKGCTITNANLSHYIRWANEYYFDSAAAGNFGLFTSISFDLSVTTIFCSLTQGGTLTVYEQQQDIASILQHSFSKKSGINAIKLTPSHVNLLQQLEIRETGINKAILGGEAVNEEHVRMLKLINPAMQVYNEYGPTEATVGCIVKELLPETPVLIGKPISATEIFILGAADQLLPVGISGEICISGAGLAKAYLNNPTLTAQKFVSNPFRSGQRMYKTGDLGRWLSDGEIQYLGRQDEQVKIRGYRIEPGEIENVLLSYPDISAAVVKIQQDELLAYLVSSQALEATAIKAYLSEHLPVYMIPAYYVQLDELPLTTNGKVDKKRLPDPAGLALNNGVEYIAPQNDTEHRLVAIWQEILGKDSIGIRDNFFDLGGHSLTAIRLITRIKKEFTIEINMKDVFKEPTIEMLADIINNDVWLQRSLDEEDDVYDEISM